MACAVCFTAVVAVPMPPPGKGPGPGMPPHPAPGMPSHPPPPPAPITNSESGEASGTITFSQGPVFSVNQEGSSTGDAGNFQFSGEGVLLQPTKGTPFPIYFLDEQGTEGSTGELKVPTAVPQFPDLF
ncbi:hypothetical protein GpartN1_g5351.t1 [Galdieria partita]|uniref:Uncharacterized protein n=1 Tax=Galdieria partita TaxID=83374 RepID=A0A9C7PZZ0_9RHOD|nr:hypothetical protein GpartN1_g5351.t1 [Galdieria partita]